MENEKRTDRNSWAELDENRLSDILTASQIKATDTYVTPPQIIWIDNSTIATLGNFSASTGKAKAKKTFNVSAIVAASLAGRQVLNYRAHLPEGKRRILYVDTEQSRFHCHNVLERILRLAGLPTTTDNENLDFICLREYTPAVRIEVIDYALRQNKGYGLAPVKIDETYYVDGGLLMNLPVSTIRRVCEKVVAINVSPLMAPKYKMNIVSVALRSYNFMFRSNSFPEREKADLLIEPYNLDGYSNRELEKAEEIFMQGYNATNDILERLQIEKGTIWKE